MNDDENLLDFRSSCYPSLRRPTQGGDRMTDNDSLGQ
jgi:hypothetical protein